MRTPAPHSRRRTGLTSTLVAALVAAPLAVGLASPAVSVSPSIVISEVYGAGGNGTAPTYTNDFIELYNAGASPVSVAGWSVQYRSASGTSAQVTPLSGTIQPGAHYLIRQAAGATAGSVTMPTPDATGSIAMGGANGVVLLASDTTAIAATGNLAADPLNPPPANLVDMVGYGTTPTSFETARTGIALSELLSAQRTGGDTDNNAADFSEAVPDAQASGPATPATLEAQSPGDRTAIAGQPIAPFTLEATGGTAPYTWAVSGLPDGLSATAAGAVSGTPTTEGVSTVTATVTDSAGTPTSDDVAFSITVAAPAPPIAIAEIQGEGPATPLPSGTPVTTEGVVTASYPTGGLNGFYIQTPGPDTTPNASDGLFVYGGTSGFATYPAVGQSVRVTGTPGEFGNQTQISATGWSDVSDLGTVVPKTEVAGTDCALPGAACQTVGELAPARERTENELFQPTAPWTVTDSYDGSPDLTADGRNDGRFLGELAVVADSDDPLVAPTEIIDAQDTAAIQERKRYNAAHRLILDDGSTWTYSTTSHQLDPFPWFTVDHSVRTGAGITFVKPVVLTERFGSWRILPQAQVVGKPTGMIEFEQTRPAAPEPVGGDIELATFNVLNFFPTTGEEFVASGLGTCEYYYDRDKQPTNNRSCNPDGPRGAANQANLVRQRDKIVEAINTVDADIVSLEELENSVKFGKPRDLAINELVSALNADAGAGTWAAVPSAPILPPTSEQDVIRNGFIYQPSHVAPVGDSVVLSDQSSAGEAFEDAREPLAQAFKRVGTVDSEAFAVIVNHFKSKGSGTPDPDGQGNATDRRVLQAQGLVAFADEFKTSHDISKVFLAGDFNAYSQEDPIQVLTAAGYASLESTSDPEEESYVFDGMVGSLDHVLANEPALAAVTGVDIWDINAFESVYYEYARYNTNVTDLYAPYAFRSSDHNPEVVGIEDARADPTVTAEVKPGKIVAQKTSAKVLVSVGAEGVLPTGEVLVSVAGTTYRADLRKGEAVIRLAPFVEPGVYAAEISYAGDTDAEPATTTVEITVTSR